MKTLFNALAVVAIANLLAIAGFVLWLRSSGRLNTERVQEIRERFAVTIAAEQAAKAAEEQAQQSAQAEVAEGAKFDRPPLTASEQLVARIEKTEMDRQREERLRREVDDLKAGLVRQQSAIDKAREELTAERVAFEDMRRRIKEFEGSAQFKKTMSVLEGLKPDKAYVAIREIITAQPSAGTEQAVSYLSAMQDRVRTKLFDQILQDDPKLAADLLERLRTRGTEIAARPENPPR